ncbi:Fc receptor-like protein 3 isoform X2 [Brienomyrus brachyistius]|uniref:Fc receptor-like protein 3 isoform X2 n=1 Tax=Brienomyrus brachyistius TaxID=42636 RepID=UPI0020B292F8|nr:Fc receptor-like protein 3 isoform X2 [Brienomyrus brachyistius]
MILTVIFFIALVTSARETAHPKAVLTVESRWTEIFPSESVTLRCDLQGGSAEWEYKWYKDQQEISKYKTGDKYRIPSVTQSDTGQYTCRGQHLKRTVLSEMSDGTSVTVSALPKAVLTLETGWTEIFITESVTLRCDLQGGSAEWEYKWYKDQQEVPKYEAGDKYRIPSVTQSDTGQYTCRGQYRRRTVLSKMSDDISVTVSALPKAVLTLETGWTEIFITENVTLRCDLQGGSAEWEYKWYKDQQEVSKYEAGNKYRILSVTQSDTGGYACRGQYRRRTNVSSEISTTLAIQVSAIPKAVLTLQSNWTEIFISESVTLRCDLQGGSAEWEYKWYKDQQEVPKYEAGDKYRILSVTQSDTGQYTCRGQYRRRTVMSEMSDGTSVTILAIPTAMMSLESGWTEIFTNESVSLRCDLQGGPTQWEYKWYRDGQEIPSYGPGDKYTITKATLSDHGDYTCRGQYRERRSVLSVGSRVLTLRVFDTPGISLKQDPPGHIYRGEHLSLTCSVQGVSKGWEYLWYKGPERAALANTNSSTSDGSNYTISSAALSHNGEYWCRARRGRDQYYTEYSKPVKLTIFDVPEAVLTLQTAWAEIFITERLTMRCEIEKGSTAWEYKWYRDGQEIPKYVAGDKYTILSAGALDSGRYSCRGQYRRPTVLSNLSNELSIQVLETVPDSKLNQYPSTEEIYTEDHVTLSCKVGVDSAGWEYLWYKGPERAALANTDSSTNDGSNYTISSAALSHNGEYWCRAQRGSHPFYTSFSDSLMLNMSVRPKASLILETGWTEMFSTTHLMLRCEVPESSAEWNYTWYRDGQQVPEEHTGERYTVTDGSGLYTCRGNTTDRPFYTRMSEALSLGKILLKRKMLLSVSGLLLFSPLVIILGCFCLKRNRKEVPPPKEELYLPKTIFGDDDNLDGTADSAMYFIPESSGIEGNKLRSHPEEGEALYISSKKLSSFKGTANPAPPCPEI